MTYLLRFLNFLLFLLNITITSNPVDLSTRWSGELILDFSKAKYKMNGPRNFTKAKVIG